MSKVAIMKVAYLHYTGFTALNVVVTFQVLATAHGMQPVFVASDVGPVVGDSGLCPLQAVAAICDVAICDVAVGDVVVVPGSDRSCEPVAELDPVPTLTVHDVAGRATVGRARQGAEVGQRCPRPAAQRLTSSGAHIDSKFI